jgi:hypothetical protein
MLKMPRRSRKNVSILSTFTKNEHLQENNIVDASFVEIEL